MNGSRPHHRPPAPLAAILRLLIRDDARTPEGDYEEYFNLLASEQGRARATAWYLGQLLRLVPERLAAKLYWSLVMWQNYLKVGRRNLSKNKVAAGINMFGLSVAVATCVSVFLLVRDFATMDRFHEHGDRIYLVNHEVLEDGVPRPWGTTPVPLGPAMEAELPQVARAVRVQRRSAHLRYGGDTLPAPVLFADEGFLDLFTFPLRLGTPDAFHEAGSVIISS